MPDPRAPPAGFGGLDRVRDRHGALAVLAHDGPDGRAGRQQDANLVVYVARPGDVAQVWPNASALDGGLRAGAALRRRLVWREVQRLPAQRQAERVHFALHDRGPRRRAQQDGRRNRPRGAGTRRRRAGRPGRGAVPAAPARGAVLGLPLARGLRLADRARLRGDHRGRPFLPAPSSRRRRMSSGAACRCPAGASPCRPCSGARAS